MGGEPDASPPIGPPVPADWSMVPLYVPPLYVTVYGAFVARSLAGIECTSTRYEPACATVGCQV
ncbi:hypothetical protein [Streptomyces sp. NPDC002619]|uniref:hypothetical protein n=1 Tax=Streptomyces sp. NPDC002619 TaxID=3364655 RepID=UPI0036B2355A